MTAEWISAIASLATMVVIAASALAALVQLRHMRSSNQITAINECRETLESREFRDAQRFVVYELPKRLADPQERARIVQPEAEFDPEYGALHMVANVFENMGMFAKKGIVDPELACDLWSYVAVRCWNSLAPFITYMRRETGVEALWENFEYFAWLCQRYTVAHPDGGYPANAKRMPEDVSLVEAVKAQQTQ